MRLIHRRYQWTLALAAAGLVYLGCTERNDVAREKGKAGGAGDNGSAGMSSAAGSDGNEGGSDGSGGSLGVSGAGVSDAGETGEGTAGAGGDGNVGDGPTMIVTGVVLGPDAIVGTSYQNGTWSQVEVIQDSGTPTQGGVGVALLGDGTGVAAMRGPLGFYSATWDGEWSTSTYVPGPGPEPLTPALGRMSAFPGGALVAHWSGPNQAVQLNTYDATAKSWTLAVNTMGDQAGFQPAVATLPSGDRLVVYYGPNHHYYCTRTYGSAWMHSGEVPLTLGTDTFNFNAEVDLVKRTGVDQVVAVFSTDIGKLDAALWENDHWSPHILIATDASQAAQETRHTSLIELADGRVALAYWTETQGIKVGFFDGSGWSDFKLVPDAFAMGYSPIAISRGAPGAVLELLYSQRPAQPPDPLPPEPEDYYLKHMRLTNEADWTWTPAALVDGDHRWATIALAAP